MSQRLINFYSQYFGDLRYNSLGECSVNCCFHDDQQASMSVNVNTGLWYCFRCDAADGLRGGDEYDFYKEIKRREGINLRFNQIKAQVDAMVGPRTEEETQAREQERGEQNGTIERPVQYVDDGKVQQWRMMLDRNPNVKAYLLNKRGLTEETLSRFDIGWDIERVTIPIPDRERRWVNIRRYSASARNGVKMMSYRTGYGDATLFPIQNLDNDIILLNEGEMDCLLANQLGYKAITVTGGASTWNDSWNELFTGKTVYICYDIDRAGKYGARKIAQKLAPYTNLLKVVHLPINDPPDGDFTDYIVGLGHSKEDFDRLLDETPIFNPNQEDNSSAGESHLVHLSQASNSEYNGRRVRFQVIVAGKDTSPYIVPKKLLIECQMDSRGCDNCLVGISGGRHRLNIRPDNPKIIQLLDCTVSQQRGIIRAMAGIPKGCTSFHLDEEESQNVDQLLLIPELDFGDDEEKYVLRKAYHVYDDGISLMANNSYVMSGLTVPDPRNQYSIHIIDSVEVSHDNISSFEMTPEKFERLKIFQSDDVHSKFEEIHKDFVYNITHIYGRDDLLTAVDLTYHSALSFDFMGKQVPKGQVECLILGDTRTGKAQPLHSKILTPEGWTTMGDIKLGDDIMNSSGGVSKVIGIYPQGTKNVYRVNFIDGSSCECCDEHLWYASTKVKRAREKPWDVMTLSDMLRKGIKDKNGNKFYIPIMNRADFNNKELPIDPYMLGLLIGDGCLVKRIDISTKDTEIINYVKDFMNNQEGYLQVDKYDNAYQVSIRKNYTMAKHLEELGLYNKLSYHKFIPDIYKFSNVSDRIALLQGLIDTDGYIEANGSTSYSTVSRRLAKDVADIVRSLGGRATIRANYKKWIVNGEVKQRLGYIVYLTLPNDIIPARITRKRERCKPHVKPITKSIDSVEFVGRMECQCIETSSPDSTYITDDYIVTHNSETVQGMMGHFRLGEFITGENVSFAGLVGGLEQNGKRMIMRWGKWPLSDKRLVVMDEVSGMHPEIIGNMSGVRTSGIAEINKIGIQQKTSARVRAIWLSNPRSGKPLAEYDYGTDAVLELIGNSEDVARFDFAMTCASSEVDSTLINRIHEHGTVPHVYTFDLCQDLVLWGWSRKKNQIHFEQEAVEIILEYANRMGRVYTSKVPLVEAANQRIKLAKLAVAAAIRLFSTTDGENVIVKPVHVYFVKGYLDEIYRKASLGYFNQSLTVRRQEQLAQQSKAKVMQFLDRNPGACNFFLNNSIFSGKNMEDLLDLERPAARRYLKFLNKCGMIQQTSAGYRKSPHFIEFLREWMNNSVTVVQQAQETPNEED